VKLAANWTLPFLSNSTFILEYFRNRSFNTTNSFPLLTAEVEAAFPGRVTRNANGDILSVDESPVTFAREESNSLRYGINLSGSFGTPDPAMARSRMGMMRGIMPPPGGRGGPPGGPGGPGGRAGAGGPGGPGGPRGRVVPVVPAASTGAGAGISLTHTIMMMSRVQLTPGGTVYDLLGGSALSSTGVARHSIELEGGGLSQLRLARVGHLYRRGAGGFGHLQPRFPSDRQGQRPAFRRSGPPDPAWSGPCRSSRTRASRCRSTTCSMPYRK
jgi:hypothetical protein